MLTPLEMRGPDMLRYNNSAFRQPLQALAIFSNSLCAHLRAAPMPRFGSVADDSVWRVPKLTSFSTFAFRRPGFASFGELAYAAMGDAKLIAIMPASTCSFFIIVSALYGSLRLSTAKINPAFFCNRSTRRLPKAAPGVVTPQGPSCSHKAIAVSLIILLVEP